MLDLVGKFAEQLNMSYKVSQGMYSVYCILYAMVMTNMVNTSI